MEFKTLPIQAAEIKFSDGGMKFSGLASSFNGVDSYGDTVVPGAYRQTLESRTRPIQLRWNHYGPVIGKWTKAEEIDSGLYMEGELAPGHSVAEDVYALLKHGSVNGLSIGFRIPEGGSEKAGNVRLLKRIELVEVSIVEEPADLAARVGDVKSAIDEIESLKQAEAFLRDVGGFSWAAAKALASQIKSVALRDGDAEETQALALLSRLRQQARG